MGFNVVCVFFLLFYFFWKRTLIILNDNKMSSNKDGNNETRNLCDAINNNQRHIILKPFINFRCFLSIGIKKCFLQLLWHPHCLWGIDARVIRVLSLPHKCTSPRRHNKDILTTTHKITFSRTSSILTINKHWPWRITKIIQWI